MECTESYRPFAAERLRTGLECCYELLKAKPPGWIASIGVARTRYEQRATKAFVDLVSRIPESTIYDGRNSCARKVAELFDLYNEHQRYLTQFNRNEDNRLQAIDEALTLLAPAMIKALDLDIKKLCLREVPTDFSSVLMNGVFSIRRELENNQK